VVLFANYATADEYPGIRVVNGNQVVLDPNWQAYNRDFTTWSIDGTTAFDGAALDDAFVPGRLVRIMTTRRTRFYTTVRAAPGTTNIVTITNAPPAGCDANGGWIAPVSAIRYHGIFAAAGSTQDERYKSGTEAVGQLIREEVQPDDKLTPIPAAVGGSV